MRLREIHICEFKGRVEIVPVEFSEEEFYSDEGYTVWEQALAIANQSGIRINRNKDLLLVAKDEANKVHGGVWSSLERDDDQDAWIFDFDVAVDPDSRSSGGLASSLIGPKLIDAALEEFEGHRAELERVYVRVWVINPKLARWLEDKRGFEPESVHGDGSTHMVYYGQ
jgi:GNAT superfamily N-acetyltransferase